MATEEEIRARYLKDHDELSDSYYKRHEMSKEAFDDLHGWLWHDMDVELIAAGYKEAPKPVRDWKAELAAIEVPADKVELLIEYLDWKLGLT